MNRNMIVRLVPSVIGAMVVSSCAVSTPGLPAPEPAPQPWTGLMEEVSAVWSADAGIDLLTGPAVIVRAFVESHALATSMGTIDVAYPGFTRAVPSPSNAAEESGDPWPALNDPASRPIVGTDRWHILRFDSDGRDVRSVVCLYSSYTSAYDLGNGKYGYVPGAMDDGVSAMQVTMTAPEIPPEAPAPQLGPARSPTVDVFGDWRIGARRLSVGVPSPDWPSVSEDVQACRDRAPDPLERREYLRQGEHPRSDYPTLPAYPGWPEAQPS